MGLDIQRIFAPSVGVDLVLNMHSLTPTSRSSIIYDTDYSRKQITIAQPLVPLTSKTTFDDLHLTTIIPGKQRKIRIGIPCRPVSFLSDYQLANQSTARAVVLEYALPMTETNIRSAFRLPLSIKYLIKAKLLYNGTEYYTSRDFSIRDISFAGLGLVIPRKIQKIVNPLTTLKLNDPLAIGMILVDKAETSPIGTFPVKAEVKRLNDRYSKTHILAGLKITRMAPQNEDTLNRFIHNAQIDELKRLSARGR